MKKPKNLRVLCKAALKQECNLGNCDGTCHNLFEFRKKCFDGLKEGVSNHKLDEFSKELRPV